MPRRPGQSDSSLEMRGKIVAIYLRNKAVIITTRNRPLKTKRRTGRPQVLNDLNKANIAQLCQQNPFSTATVIRDELQLPCNPRIIIRELHKNGIHKIPAKQQLISEQNARRRLQFCEEDALRNWELVIFSDEKTFCSSEDYTKTSWRSVNTRYEIQHIQPKKRSGRISLGYWGWMSQAGPGEQVQVNSHFSTHDYVEILEDVILPSVSALYCLNSKQFEDYTCSSNSHLRSPPTEDTIFRCTTGNFRNCCITILDKLLHKQHIRYAALGQPVLRGSIVVFQGGWLVAAVELWLQKFSGRMAWNDSVSLVWSRTELKVVLIEDPGPKSY
ncbi:hypothetical protein ILUMI_11879 [Ignelater luminosus]|uniref:Transposase Tc1-like domain-containing protein n=1 Tax=Ignelater luminosus TaxID=2038154 RepID=A0A8K0CZP4_IGNLU|nr:hypothetical protein ILUMI_11879 [Ignelater luminosus]